MLCPFNVILLSMPGRLKIIYTDYQHALVYECHNVLQNGQCVEGHDSLDLYSRSRAISPDMRTQLFKQALNLCLDAKKLTAISHDSKCLNLLPTGSEEREVLGFGSILVAILPSCQYMEILDYNCTDLNIVV